MTFSLYKLQAEIGTAEIKKLDTSEQPLGSLTDKHGNITNTPQETLLALAEALHLCPMTTYTNILALTRETLT